MENTAQKSIKLVKGISVTYECRVGNCPYCMSFIREIEDYSHCRFCKHEVIWKWVE